MEIFALWFALSFIAGVIAHQKGRSGVGFFFLSVVLSPLVGMIAALVARQNVEKVEEKQVASGAHKKCPYCAELIRKEAVVCRYCGKDVSIPLPLQNQAFQTASPRPSRQATPDPPHPSLTVESCLALLAAHGHSATKVGEDQWEITSPTSSIKRYAYSAQQLREITRRLTQEHQ